MEAETTIRAREMGRAYAACYPTMGEDEAWAECVASADYLGGSNDEAQFRAGFRSLAD